MITDKQEALDLIYQKSYEIFETFSDELKNDIELGKYAVLTKIETNSYGARKIFKQVNKKLRNDKDFVIFLLRNKKLDIFDALSYELRSDRYIALLAVKLNAKNAFYLTDELCNDREIANIVLSQKITLDWAGSKLCNDREIIISAVTNIGQDLEYASDNLKDDKEIVTIAIKNHYSAIFYASDRLKRDRELIIMAINSIVNQHIYNCPNFCYGNLGCILEEEIKKIIDLDIPF